MQAILRKAKRNHYQRSYLDSEIGATRAVQDRFDTQTFVLDSEENFQGLLDSIQKEAKPFINKVYVVVVPTLKDERYFDIVIGKVEKAFEARTYGKHVSAIVGEEFQSSQRRHLQSVGAPVLPLVDTAALTEQPFHPNFLLNSTSSVKASTVPTTRFLTPTTLLGVSFSIIVTFILVFCLLQMYDIQTPKVFTKKAVDWGRKER